jgi:hypothetical protein
MELTEQQYNAQFKDTTSKKEVLSKQKEALERAWKNRDFEIELYWKRATYFWGFIAAAFAGYFLIKSSEQKDLEFAEIFIICLGLVFSVAWYLVNIGSKKWQENWERHIDMLEDEISGPIYKTVLDKPSYSVSKINKRVSQFVISIWIFLFILFWCTNEIYHCSTSEINIITYILSALTIYFIISMHKHSKKNDNKNIKLSFTKRKIKY